ncbi:MAG: outer membrane lipoprotein carrier protein LolA [Cytophagaceae bacterium]|nr:outer membrane lipoprotein carrier protein LolA [Cytophagaceae bacterium]MDW8456058.1 outer membrane lipoprotein carrier protein LolA [Cytophagaceae bacterium]
MKKVIFILAVNLTVHLGHAQQVITQDPKAQNILDAMSKKYKDMNSFKARIVMTLDNTKNGVKESSEGDIVVKGTKFHIKTDKQEIYNNGTTVWTYIKDANEVNITTYEPEEDEVTPTKIYTIYKEGYKYRYVEDKVYNGVTYEVVELNPNDIKKNKFSKIKIEVNKKDRSIHTWKIFEKNGNVYSYSVKNFTSNIAVTDNYFNFDQSKYPGVIVNDLR